MPGLKECERRVFTCRKTLLILTRDYLASGWTEIENTILRTLDLANQGLRLIPPLKVECKILCASAALLTPTSSTAQAWTSPRDSSSPPSGRPPEWAPASSDAPRLS